MNTQVFRTRKALTIKEKKWIKWTSSKVKPSALQKKLLQMAYLHMKTYSTSLVSKEMKIKMTSEIILHNLLECGQFFHTSKRLETT